MTPMVIATWKFGVTAVRASLPLLREGRSALDAAVAGAQAVEDDPKVTSVGFGGIPDSVGNVTLDASVMDGRTLSCGAVAGVENVRHVAALARRVMERTPHVLLVGEGAKLFAVKEGFPLENLHTPQSQARWLKRGPRLREPLTHDTVTVLTLDQDGSLGGACTTSGLSYKLPGRVGDSPIIGAGLYVDDTAGAAGATGVGEEILRLGASLRIVESMRSGQSPQEACEGILRLVNQVAKRRGVAPGQIAFLALSPSGEVGAACTSTTSFPYWIGAGTKILRKRAPRIRE
jgi:isoaspartyl peptidase/L-asparaginase-like protein (Ntn-hydrolase superfamily)